VNLIIGKNDCGKTALMEALLIADSAEAVASRVLDVQSLRRSGVSPGDFDRFWRPLFRNQDADSGFSIEVRSSRPEPLRIELRRSASQPSMLTEQPSDVARSSVTWALDVLIADGVKRSDQIVGSTTALRFPLQTGSPRSTAWIGPNKNVGATDIRLFSMLRQAGREAELLEVVREVDSRVSGIEILAPTGTEAELFVRLEPGTPLLPIAMMGDGFQRCFEMAVSGVTDESLFVDELDNGLHHSILDPVWRWLAVVSSKRNVQIFATTHSEECIHAACRAFTTLNDDGLRVIRLDRRDGETTAAVYDRQLVETAADAGVELRG
jgi:hypothetical protein